MSSKLKDFDFLKESSVETKIGLQISQREIIDVESGHPKKSRKVLPLARSMGKAKIGTSYEIIPVVIGDSMTDGYLLLELNNDDE